MRVFSNPPTRFRWAREEEALALLVFDRREQIGDDFPAWHGTDVALAVDGEPRPLKRPHAIVVPSIFSATVYS